MHGPRQSFRDISLNQETRNDVRQPLDIIPRDQHSVSRKDISKAALRVLYRLHEAGYAAYLVGGAVRDLLLGAHPKDFDVATDATPEDVRRLFRNCRLIGRRFRLAHVLFGREIIEVATFRGQAGEGERHMVDGRIVRDNVFGSIEEDAVRRDFRINAMYYNIADFSVRDEVGGMEDLKERVLRLIGDPITRYREDPVRMLRAARLAAKLDFRIDDAAAEPFAELAPLLTEAPPARLFDETLKMFLGGHGLASFHMLEKHGLLASLYPLTARTLARGDMVLRQMIETGLSNTDARVRQDKPVTPSFLFALLLWGEVSTLVADMREDGMDHTLAWQRAAHRIVAEQAQRVAIPKRFSFAMEEIWALQPRFEMRTRKKVFRLLAHPRFRAAYDFLLLRAPESDDVRALGEWWTRAQELPAEELSQELAALSQGGGGKSAAPAGKRRRRRGARGRRKKSESSSSTSD